MKQPLPRVLCVDDEPKILSAIGRNLRGALDLTTAGSGAEALACLRQSPEPFTVVVTDMKMPEMNGITLLTQVRREFPDTTRILLTGYAELDSVRKVANQRKKELIAAAESLAESTDWQGTVRKLRDLMGEWKVAPRGSRGDEDKLWKRFKAAQDAFFARKTEAEVQAEEALAPNVAPKEALVVEAEALLPISDPRAAKTALRGIVDRWDAVGDLPRKDRDRLEARLKKVEEAVRRADAETWKQQGSQVRERATNAFTEKLEKLEKQRDAAQSAGDTAKAADLESQIASLRALMGR